MLYRQSWETKQFGNPKNNDYSIQAEYVNDNGTILCQLYREGDDYIVKFTATKGKRLLPRITLIPTSDYDKALGFAKNGMSELERIINTPSDS